jgi:hypothetical protein
MEVTGTGIVPKSFPCFENFFFTGKSEGYKVRKFFDPGFKIGKGGGYPCLLEHEFGYHSFVKTWIRSPGEFSFLLVIPTEQVFLKNLLLGRFHKGMLCE